MKGVFIILLTLTTLITPSSFAVNQVLSLDGEGDVVIVATQTDASGKERNGKPSTSTTVFAEADAEYITE